MPMKGVLLPEGRFVVNNRLEAVTCCHMLTQCQHHLYEAATCDRILCIQLKRFLIATFGFPVTQPQVVLSLVSWLTTWHCLHLPPCARPWPASHEAIDRYVLFAGPTAANLQMQHVVSTWDRQTDAWQLHRPCSAYYAVPVICRHQPDGTFHITTYMSGQ